MKKILFAIICVLAGFIEAAAQWSEDKTYYIQTREGLCLSNQDTPDNLALIRFMEADESNVSQKWQLRPAGNGYVIVNRSYGKAVDNIGSKYLNLFQRDYTTSGEEGTQQWLIKPVEGKEGYYTISSINFAGLNWSANYNGTVCLTVSNIYKTAQWFRINESIQPADTETQPDEEPVYTEGVQSVTFSTEEAPVWYTLNPYYANSPTANKANLLAYHDTANDRYIIKGASNTKSTYGDFHAPDIALWRLEGNAESFQLVNKGTGLRLAYPAKTTSNERFLLTEQGSSFCLNRADALDDKMSPDAFYFDPTDANFMNVGRVHCDGATAELILFKNGTADIVGGKGSAMTLIPVETRKVEVEANNPALGTVGILKDDVISGFEQGMFVYNYPTELENGNVVSRSKSNPVRITASPVGDDVRFEKWINAADNSYVSDSKDFIYSEITDVSLVAVFSFPDAIENISVQPVNAWISSSVLTFTRTAKFVSIYDISGCLIAEGTPQHLDCSRINTGIYLLNINKGEKQCKLVVSQPVRAVAFD
jgi:hypothetical protein